MTRVTIAKGCGFQLISLGNGWAYEFSRNGAAESLWFQDDDAAQFRDEWEALQAARPNDHTTELLREMWDRYSC